MKRFIGLVLVLCVVAPAFGSDEYTWTGGSADWTAGPWTLKIDTAQSVNLGWTPPAAPYEDTVSGTGIAKSRPQLTDGSVITVTTDLAPTDTGFSQVQLSKGTIIVDAGGELRVSQGYMSLSSNSQLSGMIVQNGGKYINAATGTGNQSGTLLNYTTTNARAFLTVSGTGSLFETFYLYGSRYGQTQTNYSTINVLGSGSLINTQVVGPGGNNKNMTYHFETDAGGVSAINVGSKLTFKQGVSASHVANKGILEFVLGAAPTEGQVLTLFNLADGVAKVDTKAGYMLLSDGVTVAHEGIVTHGVFEGTNYWFELSYEGGTGNDITLTAIPEPATLGLLSLGGLVLARRRRA